MEFGTSTHGSEPKFYWLYDLPGLVIAHVKHYWRVTAGKSHCLHTFLMDGLWSGSAKFLWYSNHYVLILISDVSENQLKNQWIKTRAVLHRTKVVDGVDSKIYFFKVSWILQKEPETFVSLPFCCFFHAFSIGTPEISLARVNCWDWPHLCLQENVTQFPIMKMYTKEGAWLAYSGMWETKEMMKFIEL